MKLVLAEKPSVAQSIAKVLGAAKREDGYLEGNGYVVSWCVGHLVELAQPEVYDAKYSKWAYADLPIFPMDWQYEVSAGTKKQFGIEKGEYASEDFMDEIKDVIAGLIQNYEVIRDSEVMMSKEANSIGKCPLCGSAVEDKAKAFFCSNRACKFALWKNNRYFASIGKSMTSATAQKLLGSGKVKLKNCKSERTGNTFDATVFMEVSDDGKTKFSMEFENGGKDSIEPLCMQQ